MVTSLIMYTLGMMLVFILTRKEFMTITFCKINVLSVSWSYLLSKMFMYITFIVRLYIAYNNPIFQYNERILKLSGILTIIYGLSIATAMTLTSNPYPYYDADSYIARCVSDIHPIIPIFLGLYDIILSIGSMIAFINPLKKMIKSMLNDKGFTEQHKNKIHELIQIGMKYAILTSVASITSLIFIVMVSFELSLIAPFDYITNMICMILMTPYYDDKIYFQKLCCGAIKCGNWLSLKCCHGYVIMEDEEMKQMNIRIVVTPPQDQDLDVEPTGNTTTSNITTTTTTATGTVSIDDESQA